MESLSAGAVDERDISLSSFGQCGTKKDGILAVSVFIHFPSTLFVISFICPLENFIAYKKNQYLFPISKLYLTDDTVMDKQ